MITTHEYRNKTKNHSNGSHIFGSHSQFTIHIHAFDFKILYSKKFETTLVGTLSIHVPLFFNLPKKNLFNLETVLFFFTRCILINFRMRVLQFDE